VKKIRLPLKKRSYDILIGDDLAKKSGAVLRRLRVGNDAVIVSNANILRLYGARIERSLRRCRLSVRFETVPDSERAKSFSVLTGLMKRIAVYDRAKTLVIIAFGGGVIGDLAGFVSAIYKRGIPYIQMPTTLLAQVDSAIGGKVAVDLPLAKNLAGAFYQPKIVLSDISLLRSLSVRQVRNGLAEIIKYGVIKDEGLFGYLERDYRKVLSLDRGALQHVIWRSSRIKAGLVARDEFDNKGVRVALNYGHTLGHAIEAASGYSLKYSHGEAVAIGMVMALGISSRLGLAPDRDVSRIKSLIMSCGLPVRVKGLDLARIYEAHLHDKKFIRGMNRFVLPEKIGRVRVVEGVPDRVIKDAIRQCA